jgi:hypothetical protein
VFSPRTLVPFAALLSVCTATPDRPEVSNLEKRSTPVSAPTPAAAPPTRADPPAPVAARDTKASPPGALTAEPPAGTELVSIRLALEDASVYRITTVGNVAIASMAPTAYAREEQLELDECSGEAEARRCRVTHRYRKFDAEPPAGQIYALDEKAVAPLVTRHTLLATGARDGATLVEGDGADSEAGKALAAVHRFYCLRFPDRPIGVGAKWRDSCSMRTGGVVDTRDVVWELTKLDTVDGQRRAELTYLGEYRSPGPKGDRPGVVSGILYFMVDAGEPHLLKEQIALKSSAASDTVLSTTTVAYQFARVVKDRKGQEKLVRTDGAEFPAPPAPAKHAAKPTAPTKPAG